MSATTRFRTSLILSLAIALIAGSAVAGAGSRPALQSFVGVCNLNGEREMRDQFLFGHDETTELVGTCHGRVNGRGPVSDWKARMEASGSSSLIHITAQGSGFLTLRGVRGFLSFDYERVADRAIELNGHRSRAWGAVRGSGDAYRLVVVTAGELRGE